MSKTLNPTATNLAELVGRKTLALIPWINPSNGVDIEVHGVEASGIWIECQELTDKILNNKACGGVSEVTPILFFPWTQIVFVAGIAGRPAMSRNIPKEKAN
jgi:hypothetical protein